MQTATEQMAAALEQLVLNINLTTTHGGNLLVLRPASPLAIGEALLGDARLALDRYRADPEALLREAGRARREEGGRVRDGK